MPIRNTAEDRFNPPVTYEAPLEQIRITKHVSLSWHDCDRLEPVRQALELRGLGRGDGRSRQRRQ